MVWVCYFGVPNCPECRRTELSARATIKKPVNLENAFYLAVPYAQRDQAKALGAKWNPDRKSWYVPAGRPTTPFKRWFPATTEATAPVAAAAIEAKEQGASYDELMEAIAFADAQAKVPAPKLQCEPVAVESKLLAEVVKLPARRHG